MLTLFTTIIAIFSCMVIAITIEKLYRHFAHKHPEWPARQPGQGCCGSGSCENSGTGKCEKSHTH